MAADTCFLPLSNRTTGQPGASIPFLCPLKIKVTMNQMTRWDPFHELEDVHRRLIHIFDHTPSRNVGREFPISTKWAPTVDIVEDDRSYVIKAELPEIKKEDVRVSVANGVLTFTGARKFEKEEKGRKNHLTERSYGSFARSFNLPDDIDPGKVSVSHKDGVLTISVAKSDNGSPGGSKSKSTDRGSNNSRRAIFSSLEARH